jgi:hypothetical protein
MNIGGPPDRLGSPLAWLSYATRLAATVILASWLYSRNCRLRARGTPCRLQPSACLRRSPTSGVPPVINWGQAARTVGWHPSRLPQQSLHRVRRGISGLLGQLPTRPAIHIGQQSEQERSACRRGSTRPNRPATRANPVSTPPTSPRRLRCAQRPPHDLHLSSQTVHDQPAAALMARRHAEQPGPFPTHRWSST